MKSGLWLICLVLAALSACAVPAANGKNGAQPPSPPLEPVTASPLPPTPPPQEGSIYSVRAAPGLLADLRARQVGDIITISITEKAEAAEAAQTKTSKTSGVKVGINSLFGLTFPMKTFTDKMVNADTALEGTVGNASQGDGNTQRTSTFTTYITATVIQTLPNNNLVVRGQRHMKINNETEIITVTGIVNPTDIDRSNSVPSTKVADARVQISGLGVVSDKQRQGWLTRMIVHIWPW